MPELKLVFALILTMPGVPFVYYGDEIGMRYLDLRTKEGGYQRTGSRTPMQWSRAENAGFSQAPADALYLPVDASDDAPCVEEQQEDAGSLLAEVRRLCALRHEWEDLQADAAFAVINDDEGAAPFVYRRGELVLAINPSSQERRYEGEVLKGKRIVHQIGEATVQDARGAVLKAIQCIECAGHGVAVHPRSGDATYPVFNFVRCTQCKRCTEECPFGALDERSMIVPLLLALKQRKPVVAMLAPSFVGQFGMKITPAQIIAALKRIGFSDVVEVAIGADITTLHEAEEFMEKVPKKLSFMTSSCCPAFVKLVKSRFPEYEENISKTTSPMVSCGLYVKDKSPEAMTCFIGPCIAKKREAVEHADTIDFVLTYEELQCIFEGIGIDLTEPVEEEYVTQATAGGIGFPLTRGVQASMREVLPIERQAELTAEYADGLENCNDKLTLIKNGKLSADYFEGMACCNGCVNGPGSLAQQGLTRVMVSKFQKAAEKKTSDQLQEAVDAVGKISFEV